MKEEDLVFFNPNSTCVVSTDSENVHALGFSTINYQVVLIIPIVSFIVCWSDWIRARNQAKTNGLENPSEGDVQVVAYIEEPGMYLIEDYNETLEDNEVKAVKAYRVISFGKEFGFR